MYLWIERKKKRKVHIKGPRGKSLCLAENGGVEFDGHGEDIPKGRKVCRICLSCQKSGVRDRRPMSWKEAGSFTVITKDDGFHVMDVRREGMSAGPFETQREAWKWIDKVMSEPESRQQNVTEWLFSKDTKGL